MNEPTTAQKNVDPRADNAMKFGLFSSRDLVLPNEQSEYEQIRGGLMSQLDPEGAFEETFAGEIVSARWRLRRCGLIEANLIDFMHLDEFGMPMLNPEGEKRQKSADRARAQALSSLRRCMAEFRKLQTERQIISNVERLDDVRVLTDHRAVFNAIKTVDKLRDDDLKRQMDAMTATPPRTAPPPRPTPAAGPQKPVPAADLFCKTTPVTVEKVGRNELCPCGSGIKYKRCCIDGPKTGLKPAA